MRQTIIKSNEDADANDKRSDAELSRLKHQQHPYSHYSHKTTYSQEVNTLNRNVKLQVTL